MNDLQIIDSSLVQIEESSFSYEEILEKLVPAVNHLLDTNMNSLMNILYRMDVSEQKVKKVLATSEPEKVGEFVSRLILDRQLEKIETRKKYSK